jgi:hypothetical protein
MMNSVNVMDIETFNVNNKVIPYCICISYGGYEYQYWYSENINLVLFFIEEISKKSNSEYIEIYTHNINFDGLIIIDGIKNTKISFDFFVRNHNIY